MAYFIFIAVYLLIGLLLLANFYFGPNGKRNRDNLITSLQAEADWDELYLRLPEKTVDRMLFVFLGIIFALLWPWGLCLTLRDYLRRHYLTKK